VGHALGTKGHGGVGVVEGGENVAKVREWKERRGDSAMAARREAEEKGV